MEVSTFELLLKPLPRNESTVGCSRQVVQGYSLTITNCEPIDLTFQVEFFVSPDSVNSPELSASWNSPKLELLVNADTCQKVTLFTGQILRNDNRYLGLFRIPAQQTVTVSVQLLPIADGEDLEIRGYTLLRVPKLPFSRSPQSQTPVKVLLKPETRRCLLEKEGETGFEISCPLALISDQALNEVEAETERRFIDPVDTVASLVTNESLVDYLLRQIDNFELTDSDILALAGEHQDQVIELVELVSQGGEDLSAVSELCEELNISLEQSVF